MCPSCPSDSLDSNCQQARELQINNTADHHQLHHQLHHHPPVLPDTRDAQRRRKAFAGGGPAGQSQTVEMVGGMVKYNAEEAAEVARWIQELALSMLAAEVAVEQRCALQHRLRHQLKEASGQLKEGAGEAGEAQTAV